MVSYATLHGSAHLFPEELPLKIEEVEMSEYQYHKYLLARQKEKSETSDFEKKPNPNPPKLTLPSGESSFGTYYVNSRMIGNYCKFVDHTHEGKEDVTIESPKIAKLISNLEQSPGTSIVYSQFIKAGGLGSIEHFLKKINYTKFNAKSKNNSAEPVTISAGHKYAFITGEVSEDEQKAIVSAFNSKENIKGNIIKLLLVSKTGAEGISLKNVRQVHILEPYWDDSRHQQFKARAIRLGSHLDLPETDRTVQVYIYLAAANNKVWQAIPEKSREHMTTDQLFYSRALKKERLNKSVREVLQSVSIECQFLQLEHCRVCKPTSETLFTDDIRNDIRNPDPCKEVEEIEVELHEIEYKGIKYYYKQDDGSPIGYSFYKYDPKLNAHVEMELSDPIVNELMDIIDPFVLE
jgi:hypothetical protein